MPLQSDEIWIAEDNSDVRLMLDRAFKRSQAHAHPVFFHDGSLLLEQFQKHRLPPKLFLLDLKMPVMGGLGVLKALHSEGCCGSTPVVIFSSHENPELVRRAYFAGAKLYLKKPPKIEEYSGVVKLCALYVQAIRDLPAEAVPLDALNVKDALKLVGTSAR